MSARFGLCFRTAEIFAATESRNGSERRGYVTVLQSQIRGQNWARREAFAHRDLARAYLSPPPPQKKEKMKRKWPNLKCLPHFFRIALLALQGRVEVNDFLEAL